MNETIKEVIAETLKQFPTARKIAVENFLFSMPRETSQDIRNAKANVELDTRLYGAKWKTTKTDKAILFGINLYAKKAGL